MSIVIGALVALLATTSACGDDSAKSNNGAAGTGGSGGGGGAGGNGGNGGNGMPTMANGCDSTTAIDKSSDARTTITFSGTEYTPRCVRVKAGAIITFSGSFSAHPLVGGSVSNGVGTPDSSSAIPATQSGSEVTMTLGNAGTYPYYCTVHVSDGMMGALFVD